MPRMIGDGLSRREREILEVLHRKEQATAADVQSGLPSAPSNSAVRALLAVLEKKGHVKHANHGRTYIYFPTEPRKHAAGNALRQVITTFFSGSLEQAVSAFLTDKDSHVSDDDLSKLSDAIAEARLRETPADPKNEE